MKMKKVVLILVLSVIGLILAAIVYIEIVNSIAIKEIAENAQKYHPVLNDDISALINFLESDNHSLNDKNKVVWALGRIRSTEALPILESLYTGRKCNHQIEICQYELVKALKRCGTKMEINSIQFYVKKYS